MSSRKKHPAGSSEHPAIQRNRRAVQRQINGKTFCTSISPCNRRLIFAHLLSLVFAIVHQSFGWPEVFYVIYGHPMNDRSVYEYQILYRDLRTDYISNFHGLMYFTHEWLWSYLLSYLNRTLGYSPEQIFCVITTIVLVRFSVEIAIRAGWAYVILLYNPLVIDFAYSQLRLALAISILSLFWDGQRGKPVTIAAYVVCTALHTAVALFAVLHIAANWLSLPTRRNLLLLCLTGVLLALAIGPLREVILAYLGDRRVEYPDMGSTVSYLSFWIVMWALLLYKWHATMNSIDGRYALMILSLVAANLITGGYSTRFIAASFPSLVIAMRKWEPKSINLLILLFVLYASLQWFYWLKLV